MLFVSQKEAKRNGLRFASISHGAEKKLSEKGKPCTSDGGLPLEWGGGVFIFPIG
jgi:hypothetical protein